MSRIDDVIADVAYLLDALKAYKTIAELPDCNTCGKMLTCGYCSSWGGSLRVNCPLWVSEEDFENREK